MALLSHTSSWFIFRPEVRLFDKKNVATLPTRLPQRSTLPLLGPVAAVVTTAVARQPAASAAGSLTLEPIYRSGRFAIKELGAGLAGVSTSDWGECPIHCEGRTGQSDSLLFISSCPQYPPSPFLDAVIWSPSVAFPSVSMQLTASPPFLSGFPMPTVGTHCSGLDAAFW